MGFRHVSFIFHMIYFNRFLPFCYPITYLHVYTHSNTDIFTFSPTVLILKVLYK